MLVCARVATGYRVPVLGERSRRLRPDIGDATRLVISLRRVRTVVEHRNDDIAVPVNALDRRGVPVNETKTMFFVVLGTFEAIRLQRDKDFEFLHQIEQMIRFALRPTVQYERMDPLQVTLGTSRPLNLSGSGHTSSRLQWMTSHGLL